MNVNMPTRIDESLHHTLKSAAKEAKENISVLIAREMLSFVEGKLDIKKPVVHSIKKTSLSIPHEVAVAFKRVGRDSCEILEKHN